MNKKESIIIRMDLLQEKIYLKNSELEIVENDLDDLYEAYLILKDELEELENDL